MTFEEFTKIRRSFEPRASIRSNGQIGINSACVKKHGLDQYKYAVLMYDREKDLIGIYLSNEKKKNSYRIQNIQGSLSIHGKSFIYYYEIANRVIKKKFPVEYDEKKSMIIIPIGKPLK